MFLKTFKVREVCGTLYKARSFYQWYSVKCTHLGAKMKIFATLLLLGAFVAYVSAFEMPFHKAVFKFLDERHDERMAQVVRDFGLPEDTLAFNDINAPNPTAPAKPVKPEGLPPFIVSWSNTPYGLLFCICSQITKISWKVSYCACVHITILNSAKLAIRLGILFI